MFCSIKMETTHFRKLRYSSVNVLADPGVLPKTTGTFLHRASLACYEENLTICWLLVTQIILKNIYSTLVMEV